MEPVPHISMQIYEIKSKIPNKKEKNRIITKYQKNKTANHVFKLC